MNVGADRLVPGSARRTRIVAIVAALAFALRALVPVGYMWAQVADHVTVMPCMDFAPDILSAVAQAHHHHSGHHNDHNAGTDSCPFGLASGAAMAATVPALAVLHYEIVQARSPQLDQSIPRSIPLRFLAPRGPPLAA